jgi:hypothetical protein
LQNDMLLMMLKRLLILCTRIYKEQVDHIWQKQWYCERIQLPSWKQI